MGMFAFGRVSGFVEMGSQEGLQFPAGTLPLVQQTADDSGAMNTYGLIHNPLKGGASCGDREVQQFCDIRISFPTADSGTIRTDCWFHKEQSHFNATGHAVQYHKTPVGKSIKSRKPFTVLQYYIKIVKLKRIGMPKINSTSIKTSDLNASNRKLLATAQLAGLSKDEIIRKSLKAAYGKLLRSGDGRKISRATAITRKDHKH